MVKMLLIPLLVICVFAVVESSINVPVRKHRRVHDMQVKEHTSIHMRATRIKRSVVFNVK